MSKTLKPPEILDMIVDLVLAHKPKRKIDEKKQGRRVDREINDTKNLVHKEQRETEKYVKNLEREIEAGIARQPKKRFRP
jgi:hypothetical protein